MQERSVATVVAALVLLGAACGGGGAKRVGTTKTVGELANLGIQVDISVGYVRIPTKAIT